MSLEILKLSKQLHAAVTKVGITEPREAQLKTMARISGGQDVVCIGPEGCGKTTTMVLSVLKQLGFAHEPAPRALILVPDRDAVATVMEEFRRFGKNSALVTMGLYSGGGFEGQREELMDGVDIVVGVPDRVLLMYQKSGLNINRLRFFILDDADLIIKNGYQAAIYNLVESLPKCQHLVFTEVVHDKLDKVTDTFLNNPYEVEINEEIEVKIPTISQVLYKAPNYKTKLNLINLLLSDYEVFDKVIVFTNNRNTAENVYKSLDKRMEGQVALLKPAPFDKINFETVREFLDSSEARILIATNDQHVTVETLSVPFVLHYDIPTDRNVFVRRIRMSPDDNEDQERLSIAFSTDVELSLVRKIEQEIGAKMVAVELPLGMVVEGDAQFKDEEEIETEKKSADPNKGAFHEKKASNAKTYNMGVKEKMKMFGNKRKKGKR